MSFLPYSVTIVLIILASSTLTQDASRKTGIDNRIPVVAILSQPATTYQRQFPDGGENFSEIVGSYVDWIEQTGASTA